MSDIEDLGEFERQTDARVNGRTRNARCAAV
jgi:hypothetical protein